MKNAVRFAAALASVCLSLLCQEAYAKPKSEDQAGVQELLKRLEPLEKTVKTQQAVLEEQKKKIAEQEKELKLYREKLEAMDSSSAKAVKAKDAKTADKAAEKTGSAKPYASEADAVKKTEKGKTVSSDRAESSGTPISSPKKEEERPQLDVLPDYGGVLTRKGTLMYENSLEYTNTTNNIFTFNGVKIAEVVLIGQIEATSARRQVVQDSSRFRLGITDRLEADIRLPFSYRNDSESRTSGSSTSRNTIEGSGIGDLDMGVAYQLNRGTGGWPYFVGNIRYKSDTGEGPYDVEYDSNNIAKSLPTGTGYKTAEGSLTVIKVTDPAVLFGNVGYVHSFGEDIGKTFNTTRIDRVSPGSAINASTGMGFSINQETSFTLGYKHSYVFPTRQYATNMNDGSAVESRSDTLNVGALLVGTSYRFSPVVSLNFTTEIGATRDAPDVMVGLRVPVRLGQLF